MSFLWNGLTESGNIVPIQVDAQGRVVAIDSTPGPEPTDGVGANAWASVNLTTVNGPCPVPGSFNIASVVRTSLGNYTATFTNPMPMENYAVVGSVGAGARFQPINRTTTKFDIVTYADDAGIERDGQFNFVVFAAETQARSRLTMSRWDDLVARVTKLENP